MDSTTGPVGDEQLNEDFKDLLVSLLEKEVTFLIVGAHALAVHGITRATGDLDIWIRPDAKNAGRAWEALLCLLLWRS